MIDRDIELRLKSLARQFPVIVLTRTGVTYLPWNAIQDYSWVD